MSSPRRSVFTDGSRFQRGYKLYLERSTTLQRMQDFIDNLLPDIMASTVNGKSHLNVIGVGSGSGEFDLKMFAALHLKNPEMTVDNEVVEPNPQQLSGYKELVSQTPGLDHITFNWSEMTSEEFVEQWKEKKRTKKADLIHMFQMLFYVKDRGATISFYQSLLDKKGKLLICLDTGDSGWAKLLKTYGKEFSDTPLTYVFSDDVKRYLDSEGLSYQSYLLPSQLDITECFTEGDENGELMIDHLTDVLHFRKVFSPELKAEIMEYLRLDCSEESDGKVLLNDDYEMIVLDPI